MTAGIPTARRLLLQPDAGWVAALTDDFDLAHAALLHGWVGGRGRWSYWFVEVLVQVLVAVAVAMAVPVWMLGQVLAGANEWARVAAQVALGGFIYLALLYLTSRSTLLEVVALVVRRRAPELRPAVA